MTLLEAHDIHMEFGGVSALDSLTFTLVPGVIHSIIGPNGAGKTTLFNVVSGLYRPTHGRLAFDGIEIVGKSPHALAALGISRTFQNLQIFFNMSALENVMVGCHLRSDRNVLSSLFHLPAVVRSNAETRRRAAELIAFVGLESWIEAPADSLPYGALKRLEIARALATDPRLLLLDEPAAGCNPRETREIDALIQRISGEGTTVVLVEHDMHMVMGISDHILVLNYGRKLAEGTAAEIRSNPEVVAAYLGAEEGRA
jgi:branched-chain amino acid transport system ATP-binding protein